MNAELAAFADPEPTADPGRDRTEHPDHRGRVTVDIDGYVPGWKLKAVRAYHNLSRSCDDVEVHISSSGNGLHLVGWTREPLSHDDRMRIRANLNDDENRQAFDEERAENGVYTGVLWSTKSDNPGGAKDRDFGDVHAAIEHMTMTRDPHERMKRLANHGHRGAPELAHHAGEWEP